MGKPMESHFPKPDRKPWASTTSPSAPSGGLGLLEQGYQGAGLEHTVESLGIFRIISSFSKRSKTPKSFKMNQPDVPCPVYYACATQIAYGPILAFRACLLNHPCFAPHIVSRQVADVVPSQVQGSKHHLGSTSRDRTKTPGRPELKHTRAFCDWVWMKNLLNPFTTFELIHKISNHQNNSGPSI